MSSPASTPSSGGNVFKNIIVGVITTVAGAAIIYFLGFHENSNDDFKKRKEATETAWNSYHSNMDIISRVIKKMDDGSSNLEKRKTDINHEVEATILSLNNIKKDANIDSRVNTIIDLKVPLINDFRNLAIKYIDDIIAYAAQNPAEEQGRAFLVGLVRDFKTNADDLRKRDSVRLDKYYKELEKEYKLKMPE